MHTYEEMVIENVFEAVGIAIERRAEFRSDMERQLAGQWGAGANRWDVGQCKICGTNMGDPRSTLTLLGETLTFTAGCCDRCIGVRNAHYDHNKGDSASVSRHPIWDETCPALYKELVEDPPEVIPPATFRRVREWMPSSSKRGMVLVGDSGTGKTTALWALFRALETAGDRAIFLTAVELQRQLSEAARDIKDVKHLTHCRVLMIDDLGKEKLTASVGALLWEIVDARYANRRPMVISTRYAGEAFESRFGDGILGKDIRRRLLDCCEPVRF